MGIFWTKKVFGLKEALKAESIAAIPAEHATTAMAILEAVNVPVTAGVEAAEKIAELKDSVKGMEGGIDTAKTELNVTPVIAGGAIDTLKAELKKLVAAIRDAVLGKVDAIEDVREKDIKVLEHQIKVVRWKAGAKVGNVRVNGDKKAAKIEAKFSVRIAEVEERLRSDLANLKDRIGYLEAEVKSTKNEIGILEPIAKKWILPTPKK